VKRALSLALTLTTAASTACGPRAAAPTCPPAPASTAPVTPGTAPAPTTAAPAAGPPIDAAAIAELAATRSYDLGSPRPVALLPDGDVLFLRTGPRSVVAELYELDGATGDVRKLASAADLIAAEDVKLSAAEKARRERTRTSIRGIVGVGTSDDGNTLLIPLGTQVFVLDRRSGKARALDLGAGYPDDPRLSPDGKRVGFLRDGDLWVAEVAGGAPRRITRKDGPDVSNGAAEFVAQEELERTRGYWWSPDAAQLIYQRTDESKVDTLYVSNPGQPDQPPTPFRYPRAGTTNADVRLGIIGARGGKTTWIDWDRTAFPYVRHVQWPAHAPPTLVVMNRAQTEARVLAVEPKTGKTRVLVSESDPAWVNVADGPRWMADGKTFLWASDRTGPWQLEVRAADGAVVRTIDIPGFEGGVQVDDDTGTVWVEASTNPTETHFGTVDLGSGAYQPMTTAPGVHKVIVAEKGGTRIVDTQAADGKRSKVAVRRDGTPLAQLPSVAEEAPRLPRVTLETVTVDGRTHHAAIVRPRDFDPARRYPVILQVYAGPGVTTVWNSPRRYFKDQLLADTGFIVVRSDGRGTPRRGRAWERVISRDLISVPMADQVAALQALGASHPELDLDRVGVMGWSFGGYFAAMAVLLRPDVFKAAIAGAPVTDWRFYDTAYTERYMGLPAENAAAYDRTSAVALAERLSRPLLLVHGLTDDNVYIVNTLALAQALFRAGKPHEVLTLGSTHMMTDPAAEAALLTREIAFFREHLGAPSAPAER